MLNYGAGVSVGDDVSHSAPQPQNNAISSRKFRDGNSIPREGHIKLFVVMPRSAGWLWTFSLIPICSSIYMTSRSSS